MALKLGFQHGRGSFGQVVEENTAQKESGRQPGVTCTGARRRSVVGTVTGAVAGAVNSTRFRFAAHTGYRNGLFTPAKSAAFGPSTSAQLPCHRLPYQERVQKPKPRRVKTSTR